MTELYHYGVKGMKWGVRKQRSTSQRRQARKASRKTKMSKVRNYTGGKKSDAVSKYRKKDINGMSNADLQKAINRMNLEKQYRRLTRMDFMLGQKYASDALKYNTTYKAVKKAVGR